MWTQELNALLNQCVFASGYDFAAASEEFCQQAIKLRLWTGDGELLLTANQCQEQWMALNPTEDSEDDEEEQGDKVEAPKSHASSELAEETTNGLAGPRLELSLSDAELDQLLSTLPPDDGPEGDSSSSSADAKERQARSEMQWVLAFLTDPDAIARVDVEAKNLVGSPEKHNDDNYQVFLQDLHDANLLAPAPTSAPKRPSTQQDEPKVDDDSSSDESEEEWERTRQAIKQSMKLR